MSHRPYLLLALALLPAACHPPAIDAPSLAPRPVERQPIDLPDADASEPEGALDPALAARLAEQTAAADAGHRRFEAERAGAERRIRSGTAAAQGSEAWVQGQQALSGLDVAQAPVRQAAAAIDGLRETPAYQTPANRTAIDAAAARVAALADAEAQAIAAFSAPR